MWIVVDSDVYEEPTFPQWYAYSRGQYFEEYHPFFYDYLANTRYAEHELSLEHVERDFPGSACIWIFRKT